MDDVLLASVCIFALGPSIKFIKIPPKVQLFLTYRAQSTPRCFFMGKLSSQRRNSPDIRRNLLPLRWCHCRFFGAPKTLQIQSHSMFSVGFSHCRCPKPRDSKPQARCLNPALPPRKNGHGIKSNTPQEPTMNQKNDMK